MHAVFTRVETCIRVAAQLHRGSTRDAVCAARATQRPAPFADSWLAAEPRCARFPRRNRVFARVRSCPAGDGALPHCCVARAMAQTARCRPDCQRVRGHPRLAQLLAKRQAAHRDPKRAGRAGSPQARLNGGCDASVRARPSLRCARWVRVTLPRFSGWASGHPRSVVARLPGTMCAQKGLASTPFVTPKERKSARLSPPWACSNPDTTNAHVFSDAPNINSGTAGFLVAYR